MTDAWLIWGTLVWREGGIVRLGKEVYHNHIIKEKQLNLDREADQPVTLRAQPMLLAFHVSCKLTESGGRETKTQSRSGKSPL